MAKLYKLTDKNGQTCNNTQWGPGVSHSGTGEGGLCGCGWIHAYEHPLIAVLMNPIHAGFKNPRLWEAEGEVGLRDGQIKCGCKTLTTVREIPLPEITTEMRVLFAIMCAKDVCAAYLAWNAWADKWLSGEDRTQAAAREAAWAADAAAWEAARAARAAEAAAWEAARAAERAADAAREAAWAAEAAAAMAAEAAARAAARACTDIFAIAEEAWTKAIGGVSRAVRLNGRYATACADRAPACPRVPGARAPAQK